jgi:sec-independent protein translocase protein TatB
MFDIGWGEIVVIGVVALIVIGPKELPTVLRTLGQAMGKVRRMANEFQGQFHEALREAELYDLKKQAEDFTSDISGSMNELTEFDPMTDTKEAIEHSFDSIPNTEAMGEAAAPAAGEIAKIETSKPAAALPEPALKVPEPPAPVASEDLAPAAPQPKPAGGSA